MYVYEPAATGRHSDEIGRSGAWRASALGHTVVYEPGATAWHPYGACGSGTSGKATRVSRALPIDRTAMAVATTTAATAVVPSSQAMNPERLISCLPSSSSGCATLSI